MKVVAITPLPFAVLRFSYSAKLALARYGLLCGGDKNSVQQVDRS
jgi:hypothetical protein